MKAPLAWIIISTRKGGQQNKCVLRDWIIILLYYMHRSNKVWTYRDIMTLQRRMNMQYKVQVLARSFYLACRAFHANEQPRVIVAAAFVPRPRNCNYIAIVYKVVRGFRYSTRSFWVTRICIRYVSLLRSMNSLQRSMVYRLFLE